MKSQKLILWFDELTKEDIPLVGGKNANLGEMLRVGIPVPLGFAITAYAYKRFAEETGITQTVYEMLRKNITDPNNPRQCENASNKIKSLIESSPMPVYISEAIKEAYRKLCEREGIVNLRVAVRSSATAEDLPEASFAGQLETYLNVSGDEKLLEKVVKCWSSLFTSRAISYRIQKNIKHEDVLISVGVQKLVIPKVAGVMFTLNPVTGDRNQIVIEANWGFGESVVSGAVTPDHFVVDKNSMCIIKKKIAKKMVEYTLDPATEEFVHDEVPFERQEAPCLTNEEISKLAELGKRIEEHYGRAQDIEWAIDRNLPFPDNIFIIQSRPETIWSAEKSKVNLGKDVYDFIKSTIMFQKSMSPNNTQA